MNVRVLDLEKDYDILATWWGQRKLVAPSKVILQAASGVVVQHHTVDIVAGFLYVTNKGVLGFVEWVVSNPGVVDNRAIKAAVNMLYDFLENYAKEAGCAVVLASTQADGSLPKFLEGRSWNRCDSHPHCYLLKELNA